MNSELIDVIRKLTAVIQEKNEENLVLKTDLERKTATKKDYYDAVKKIENMKDTRELLETILDGQESIIQKTKGIVEKSGKSKLRTELQGYLKYTGSRLWIPPIENRVPFSSCFGNENGKSKDIDLKQESAKIWSTSLKNMVAPFYTGLENLSKQVVLQTKEELK